MSPPAGQRLVLRGPYEAEFEAITPTPPQAGQLLIKTAMTGISVGTEMALYRGDHPNLHTKKWGYWTDYPIYPGYELAGVVEQVGARVDKSQVDEFQPGDRVIALAPHATYGLVGVHQAAKLPDHVSWDEALAAVLATTTMHATRRAQIQYGDVVVVVGVGMVGLLAVQHARLAGARRVVAVDINPERLALAAAIGVDATIDARTDPDQALKDLEPLGADVVIEAAGVESALQTALGLVRERGRVVVLGYHARPETYLLGDDFFHKELTLVATRAIGPKPGLDPTYVRWTSDRSLRHAVELISTGRIRVRELLGPVVSFGELPDLYASLDRGDLAHVGQIRVSWSR